MAMVTGDRIRGGPDLDMPIPPSPSPEYYRRGIKDAIVDKIDGIEVRDGVASAWFLIGLLIVTTGCICAIMAMVYVFLRLFVGINWT